MNRLHRNLFLSFVSLPFIPVVSAAAFSQPEETERRPNIILFLVDDFGWQDTSLPFADTITANNRKFHTPNMECLAKEGEKFTDAYATPVSTPTRVSLLTGMNVTRHHVTNWTHPRKNRNTDVRDGMFAAADWNLNGLSPVPGVEKTVYATPFPQLLKEAGYFTVHVGKAHWGAAGTPGASPYNLGFLVNIAGHAAGHPQSYLSEEEYGNLPGKNTFQSVPDMEAYYHTGTFLTQALTQEALKAIEQPISEKRPFFLHLAHYAVHTPIMADSLYFQKYLDQGLDSVEARYASLVEGMDASLGEVMDFLKEKKIEDNTVVIFFSDNGGLSLAPPRGGKSFTQNLPLRAGKGSVYEGGIRVPLIIKYPGKTPAGSVSHYPFIVEDLFPSILEMAGIRDYETVQLVDGRSVFPFLEHPGSKDVERELVWHYPNKWIPEDGPGINYFSAIRKGDWKLVYNQRTNGKELYNLKNDLGEKVDLSGKYPQETNALYDRLSTVLKENKAPQPVRK